MFCVLLDTLSAIVLRYTVLEKEKLMELFDFCSVATVLLGGKVRTLINNVARSIYYDNIFL